MVVVGPLLGTAEVAELFGVKTNVVSNWRQRGKLPEPVARLRCGPVWSLYQFVTADLAREALAEHDARRPK